MKNLGSRIKLLRKRKGWSLDELSNRCNIPKTTIWGIEKGSQTSLDNLNKIASAFNIDIYELIDSDSNTFGYGESGDVHVEERVKFTNENIKKLIYDIYTVNEDGFNLSDEDFEYITSSLKNYIVNLVDYITYKNNLLISQATKITNNVDESTTNKSK